MALRMTPTIAICLTAGIATGIALARPGNSASTADPRYESTSTPVSEPAPAAAAITIEDFDFSGQTAVAVGTAIAVTNLDGSTHTLTSDDGLFDTSRLGQNGSASIAAPDTPGEYGFFCQIHPSMRGTLVVG
jgi:plastocyanin